MGNLAGDYIDLVASGDKRKISCVLLAAGSAAGVSAIAAGTYFAPANVVPGAGQAMNATAAGIGAVLGALLAAKSAYKFCGGASARGSFDLLFEKGKIDSLTLQEFESNVQQEFKLTASEARLLAKAAYVYSAQAAPHALPEASAIERKNAVAFLLQKLSQEGLTA
jgi:hypothetical protein